MQKTSGDRNDLLRQQQRPNTGTSIYEYNSSGYGGDFGGNFGRSGNSGNDDPYR